MYPLHPMMASALAEEHIRELRRQASQATLARRARTGRRARHGVATSASGAASRPESVTC